MKHRQERGVALLTVITALMALLVIAVPFAITMRLGYERSEKNNARVRAKRQVDSTLRFLESVLVKTTERVEVLNRANNAVVANNSPERDTVDEYVPTIANIADALGVAPGELQDAYGTILGWSVEDENGKLNLNSASFFALGNLLGLSVASEKIPESATSITLEDAANFPSRGYVKIGRELVKYASREGNRLVGCERGVGSSSVHHGGADSYEAGQWVVNYAAWAISYYAVGRHPGEFVQFDTLDVSDISLLTELDSDTPVITQAEWERVLPFVTSWSQGDVLDGWANVQPVAEGTALPSKATDADTVKFRNSAYYNTGTIVRFDEKAETNIERDRQPTYKKVIRPRRKDYGMVYDSRPAGRYESRLELFGKVHRTFSGNQMRLMYRTRQPVNVNSAPREVLVALFANLRLKTSPKEDRVTLAEAGKVADEIIRLRDGGAATAIGSMSDFHAMLGNLTNKQQAISVHDRRAIHRNALNSHDQVLEFGTAPICFHTFDVYTLRVTATISDRGGKLLAKHSATRVVEIGSQRTASRVWETQRDFEEQLIASQDPRFWTTGPINTGQILSRRPIVEPWYRWPKQLNRHVFPRDPYDTEQNKVFEQTEDRASDPTVNGDIRLAPARLELDDTSTGSIFVEHFDHDDFVDGNFAKKGYALEGGLEGQILDAVLNGRVRPFGIQFWYQPQAGNSGDVVLFDCGESEFQNRYACFVDGGTSELVFAVADNTDTQRRCELRYDLGAQGGFLDDVWYHIQLMASGCHPSRMAMLVDGRAVGQANVQSHLSGSLSTEDGTIRIEDASGFPSKGAVLVGLEVIEFESRADGQLTVRTNPGGDIVGRGARGTPLMEHAEGQPVTLFGYSRPVIEGFRKGGATLDGEVGPWSLVQLDTQADFNNSWSGITPTVEQREFQIGGDAGAGGGGGPNASAQDPEEDPTLVTLHVVPFQEGTFGGFSLRIHGAEAATNNETIADQLRAFQQNGYCLVVYLGATEDSWEGLASGDADGVKPIVEFMKFTNTGGTLELERLNDNDGSKTAPERDENWEILLFAEKKDSQRVIQRAAQVWIAPVSVHTSETDGEAYINPVQHDHITHWVAQLFSADDNNEAIWEWFRYSEILNPGGGSYFLQARVPNEEVLFDVVSAPGWDAALINFMSSDIDGAGGAGEDPGGDDEGEDPGGEDPGDGGGGGPPTAPPSDGPGGDPGVDPGGGEPDDDGPGGDPGGVPDGGGSDDDGPGADPGGEADHGGAEGDGPGGDPGGDPGTDPDGGGTEGDGGGAGPGVDPGSIPPDDGGGGSGDEPGDEDPDTPGTEPDGPTPEVDEVNYLSGDREAVADALRFRGVQDAPALSDSDIFVDDWWKDPNNPLHPDGAEIHPIGATYGGPQTGAAGTDYCIWPQPGVFDDVNLVTGDDETREGSNLTVHWAMTGSSERLKDDTDNDKAGDADPYEFDLKIHLVAMNRPLENQFMPSESVAPLKPDVRQYTRLICFPSGEMMDKIIDLSAPGIAQSLRGEQFSCVVDEIAGAHRNPRFGLCLADEVLSEDADIFTVTSAEGVPNKADLPKAPGVVQIGQEKIVYGAVEIVTEGMRFSDCARGVLRSEPRAYERGAPVEVLFGIRVALLTEGATESGNQLAGIGFQRFPRRTGVVRLEDAESQSAELRLYTVNKEGTLEMPVTETGSGLFNGRYGTTARAFDAGTPVFLHPIRVQDRFSEFNDDAELSFWSFSTELTDAFVKRIYWDEGRMPARTNVRVVCRLNEAIEWNATSQNVILRKDGETGGAGLRQDEQRLARGNPLKFLYGFEDPQGDNLIRLQADKVEVRFYVIFEENAYNWADASEAGWKSYPVIQQFGIEYVQQNRVRRHIDR